MSGSERCEEIKGLVEGIRAKIGFPQLRENYFASNGDAFNKLCVAMDTLEDTLLGISHYFAHGLGNSDGERYLRLYGVLQAVVLQQDAIKALWEVVMERTLELALQDSAWNNIRIIRNYATGHPIKTWSGERTYLTRASLEFGFVGLITENSTGESKHWGGKLEEVVAPYLEEALPLVREIGEKIKERWPFPVE